MDQPLGMGGGQSLGHLAGEIDGSSWRQRAIPEEIGKRSPLNVLHDDPVPRLVAGLHEVEDLDDVGVVQPRRRPRLAAEPFPPRAAAVAVRPHPLGRHRPLQTAVPGEEDLPHAT